MKIERRAADGRWESNFGRLVSTVGAVALAGELGVDRSAVYQWVRGDTPPEPITAVQIRFLAEERGFQVSLDDIYANFSRRVEVRGAGRRPRGSARPAGKTLCTGEG